MSAKVTLPSFRINPAALGRRLASTILKAQEADLSPEAFTDTVCAVLQSSRSEDYTPSADSAVDTEILAAEQAEIEKSVRRSEIARKVAERRRKLREQATVMSETKEKDIEEPETKETETMETETKEEVMTQSVAETATDTTLPQQPTGKRRRRNRRRKKKSHQNVVKPVGNQD